MAITVYEYGLLPPTTMHREAVEQLRLAHRYQNKLVEIERARRERYTAVMRELGAEDAAARVDDLESRYAEASAAAKAAKSGPGAANLAALKAEAKALAVELKAARAVLRAVKLAIRENPASQARIAEVDEAAAQAHRDARAVCGVYWGTYLLIEQAAQQAKKSVTPPRFSRFDGEGSLAVQISYGIPSEGVFGDDTRVRVRPVPSEAWDPATPRGERRRLSRTTLKLRIGSDGRAPIWAEWPMVMHRPLPKDGLVKWVKVIRRGRATEWRWFAQFTVETPDPVQKAGGDRVAIDIGWRNRDGIGLRVAYWSDDAGQSGEVVLDGRVTGQLGLASGIRSQRDRDMDDIRAWLVHRRKADDVPEWFRERTQHVHAWRAAGKFAVLTLRATDEERAALPADIFQRLEAWRKRDRHLWQYETGARQGAVLHRREVYRRFAADLCRRYGTVVIEDFDLRKVAEAPKPENEPARGTARERLENTASGQRFMAATSVLRQTLVTTAKREGVTVVQVPAAGTTQDCHACGLAPLTPWDAAAELEHACEHCGAVWDQDHNAARNLLTRAAALSVDPEALASAVVGGSQRAPRFAKRHKRGAAAPV